MPDSTSNNKRIAKNTIYLYLRTIVVLCTSLYTSRIVLEVLGVTDMGVYNVVGGIVTMMTILQTAQAKATSRFITYDLGQGSSEHQIANTFSVCMTIHIIIAIILLIICETAGLAIINYWTNIPKERHLAANVAYQFATLTVIAHIIRVPYDSVVIAHEKMSAYAAFSILETFLKLATIYAIKYLTPDKLIIYSGSLTCIAIVVFSSYYIYVKRNYPYYKYSWLWDKDKSKEILSFSGLTLATSATNTITQQGVSLLLNNFVGLVANAALGFANQVSAAVNQFVASFTVAFNPQIIKLWSQNNLDEMHKLMSRASKFSFVLAYLFGLPIIANMDFLLGIWLKEVPEFTCVFSKLLVCGCIIDATTGVFNTAICANGNIKRYQILISLSFVADLLCAYLILQINLNPAFVFVGRLVTRGLLNMIIGLYYTSILNKFNVLQYIRKTFVPILLTLCITIPPIYLIQLIFDSYSKLFVSGFVSVLLILTCTMFIIMDRKERTVIINTAKNKILKYANK